MYTRYNTREISNRKATEVVYTYLTCRVHIPQIQIQQAGNKFLQALSLVLFQFSSGRVEHRPKEEHTAVKKNSSSKCQGQRLISNLYRQCCGRSITSLYFQKQLIYHKNFRNNIFLKKQLERVHEEFITHSNVSKLILLLSSKPDKIATIFVYKKFRKGQPINSEKHKSC